MTPGSARGERLETDISPARGHGRRLVSNVGADCGTPCHDQSPRRAAGDTLLVMASPEQVSRRVERAEQDITAISDTTLDIKETVDGHTETLAQHGRTLAEHGRTLAEHGRTLAEHGRTLAQQGRTLAEHGRKLDGITGRLDTLETRINQGFAEILRRLDNNPPSD